MRQGFPDTTYEKEIYLRSYDRCIGVDEVGRGALAGPVMAGAACLKVGVIQDEVRLQEIIQLGIDDSKRLSRRRREELIPHIDTFFYTAVGIGSVTRINRDGIVNATQYAMRQAVTTLIKQTTQIGQKSFLLLDAFYLPHMKYIPRNQQLAIVKGDQICLSIAAASIVAKVYRDAYMNKLARQFPQYGWDKNVGYGTMIHTQALRSTGKTKHHRDLFIRSVYPL